MPDGRGELAGESDLKAIPALQKQTYPSEAELYGDFSIPPLFQTEADIADAFSRMLFLKIEQDATHRYLAIAFFKLSMSMGFDTYPSIPEAMILSLSPAMA